MEKQTLGSTIAALRKEKGMTQLELAEKMGVTDKAVSKWEHDLSYPDVSSIPKLAAVFNISVDELMQVPVETKDQKEKGKYLEILQIALKAIPLAMGVAVLVLSVLGELETSSAISMLGIGIICLAGLQFIKKE